VAKYSKFDPRNKRKLRGDRIVKDKKNSNKKDSEEINKESLKYLERRYNSR
jgi:hypothetical protein